MKRLVRAVFWVGVAAAALWLTRALLKRWIDGPQVTRESGGWPTRSVEPSAWTPPPARSPAEEQESRTKGTSVEPAVSGDESAPSSEGAGKPPSAARRPSGKSGKGRGRRIDVSEPGAWVVPNGSADVLLTHPVKAKLGSRVYRVPGMPMYERTVADRCYTTVEAAETDGFNRAAR